MFRKFSFLLLCCCFEAHAGYPLFMDGMTFTAGYWGNNTNRNGFRVAGRWDWDVVWLPKSPIQFTGYWEGGFGYWQSNDDDHDNNHLVVTSASPIFQMWLGPVDLKRNAFFFEFGIGPSYFSNNELGRKNFGGLWHFEDKFGAGINIATARPVQMIYRYYHYSNLGVIEPNDGLDIHTIGIVWFF